MSGPSQASRAGLSYRELANGFAACSEPERLQAICDRPGPADPQAFCDRWLAVIPTPLSRRDREAGYWWELSLRPVEVSRTLVLDDPRRARAFFESLVADNIGIDVPRKSLPSLPAEWRRTPLASSAPESSAPARKCASTFKQTQPGEAVPQRGEGNAHRDRH